jgi:hypothetical protein
LSLIFASSLIAKAVAERERGRPLSAFAALLDAMRFNPRFALRSALRAIPGAKRIGQRFANRMDTDPTRTR